MIADTQRTRAAADGSAVGFAALAGFADPLGSGIGTDYMAVRDPQGTLDAGSGWRTHAITPLQSGSTYDGVTSGLEPLYVGEFTSDLTQGIFSAESSLTADPYTLQVPNLYLRADLRTPGAGTYALISGCPLCASRGRALPGLQVTQSGIPASHMRPFSAGMSADGEHVAFESPQPLTADAPISINVIKLYEWDQGTVRLAGRIPPAGQTACDDATQVPVACVASGVSIAGQDASGYFGNYRLMAHIISDGSDGHTRVLFTRPTQSDGVTLNPAPFATTGQLFMRTDGTSTVQLNVSERMIPGTRTPDPDATAPATYLDASADGRRVFFMTNQALTTDAPADGVSKLYMYDATQPDGAHLTFLSPDTEPADSINGVKGTVGLSADGHYVYFIAGGQLISGLPPTATGAGFYVWHDGTLRYIGPAPFDSFQSELYSGGTDPVLTPREARVTPDGRHLLLAVENGTGFGGYDHGLCLWGGGCRELYVYDADTGTVACSSCNLSGAPATQMAADQVRDLNGASASGVHQNEAITDDGTRVFFSTAEALVPEDVNGKSDAYEWTVTGTHGCVSTNTILNGCVALLSTGTSTEDSWFMDASKTGDDAFFDTEQPLVGWDTDQAYDLYDARVGGGWPEPPPAPINCAGDACQGATLSAPLIQSTASATYTTPSNLNQTLKPHPKPKPALTCRRGTVKKRVRGKLKCVKRPRPKSKAHRAQRALAGVERGRS